MASVAKRTWTHNGVKKSAWVVRCVDRGGTRQQKTFDQKKEADKYRIYVENEIEKGTYLAASKSVTIAQLSKEYLAAAEIRLKEGRRMGQSHYNSLSNHFRVHIVPHIGDLVLSELTWRDVDGWAAALRKSGRLSPHTVKRMMYVLKFAVDFAMRRDYVRRNIIADVMKEHRGGKRATIRTFTADEVRQLLLSLETRARNTEDRTWRLLRCFVYIAACCGLRRGEICGLTLGNVDFARRVIQVRHNLTEFDELKGPKTQAGVRDVPMPAVVADQIREWVQRYYIRNQRGLIFRGRSGGPIVSQSFLTNLWRPLLKRSGLAAVKGEDAFHFHALRHFAASMMIEHHLPITDVASLMGHSGFDVTLQVYAHPIAGGHRRYDAIESISSTLLPTQRAALPPPMAQG